MLDPKAVYRSLAASGAVLVAFIGLAHEFVGASLFPWGPATFGGPVGWHAAGLACVVVGLLLLAGTLHIFEVPLLLLSTVVACIGAVITAYTAAVHNQFHFFAVALCVSGLAVAVCHRRAEVKLNGRTHR